MKKEQKVKWFFFCCCYSLKSSPKHLNFMPYIIFLNGKDQLASINDIFIFMNKDFFQLKELPVAKAGTRWIRKLKKKKYWNIIQSSK